MSLDHYFSQEPTSKFEPKQIEIQLGGQSLTVDTASGTFSPGRLDSGTEILINHVELAPKEGAILDLGCGWGPITLALALNSPRATIFGVDINPRSLALTKLNSESLALTNVQTATPEQIHETLEFSGIWSNPPIRIGKKELHDLLLKWLPRLTIGGEAYLVVQKNLGSDSLQRWLTATLPNNFEVSRLTSERTYRIIKVRKTS